MIEHFKSSLTRKLTAQLHFTGIGDNVTTDFKTLEKLVRLIKNIGHISLFILTLHGQHPRLTEKHQEVLRLITR